MTRRPTRKPETGEIDRLEMEARMEDDHREFLLSALRAASLRMKMWEADINTIGVALKNNMIGNDTAVSWVRDAGLLWAIGAIPEQVGRIAKTEETTMEGEQT